MDERLKKLLTKIAVDWKKVDSKKKFRYIAGTLIVVVIIGVILAVVSTPQYELLYTGGLNDTETAQVYSAVQAQGIAAKVVGSDIYVKKGTADQVRMQLAEDGLPQGNLAYDITASGSTWAETDKDKEIQQLEQTQNRLQDAIVTISGINRAIVTIAESNSDDYVLDSDAQPTTAGVMLSLTPGFSLSDKQVTAIINMVAHSVTGLTADNVSVTDQDGTLLTGGDSGLDGTANQLELQSIYENAMKAKITPLLQSMYGAGNYNVAVNATINFNKTSTQTVSYSSGVPATTSSTATYTGGSGGAGGITGVSGGAVTYPTSSSTSNIITSAITTGTTYDVGTVEQEITNNGGDIQKLTVAVLLNNRTSAVAATNTSSLSQTVALAVGAASSDVSIQMVNFSSSASVSSLTTNPLPPWLTGINMLYAIAGAGLLLIFIITILIVLLMQHNKKRKKKEQELLLAKMQADSQAKTDSQPGRRKNVSTLKSIEETIEESQNNSMKGQIEEFADKKPELVAQILKNWLKE